MTAFQRARTDEQRAERREVILQAASSLALQHGVLGVSLNEIARQARLAKSNVLRYFESREAILLTLLGTQYLAWTEEVATLVPFALDEEPERRVASVIASTILERPLLCDLITAAPAVLEANLSAEVALEHRSRMVEGARHLVAACAPALGTLDRREAKGFVIAMHAFVATAWTAKHLSPGMAAAFEQHPELRMVSVDPQTALEELLTTFLMGLKARSRA